MSDGSWNQLGIDIDGEAADDESGWSVSLSNDGNIVAIGANYNDGVNGSDSGHVRVYKYIDSSWNQLGDDIDGEATLDYSGTSVSLSNDGTIVAIGANYNDGVNGSNSGHVRIFEYTDSSWNKLGDDIDGEAAGDESGFLVSLSGDGQIVAIGANGNDGVNGSDSGHVRVYKYIDSSWNKIGDDIDGEAIYDYSGWSVSLSSDGTIVAIGAIGNDGVNGSNSGGHVRIFEYTDSSWNQLGDDIDGEAPGNWSGTSVSLSNDGNIVAIGANYNDGVNGSNSGHVRVYKYIDSSWNQLGDDIDGEATLDYSGTSVSLSNDGTIVAIGANYNDGVNGSNSGHVRIFEYTDSSWNKLGDDIDGEAAGDESGRSVSLSGDGQIVAIGANYGSGNTGHVRVYQYTESSDAICFLKGSLIKTDFNGIIPIENIKTGEIINGYKAVNVFSSTSNKNIIKFDKDSLDINKPDKDLYVTEDHLILDPIQDKLLFANNYVNGKTITVFSENKNNTIYHILFKKWILVEANNLKCESVCPLNKKSIIHMVKNNNLTRREYFELVKKHMNFDYNNVYHVNNMIFC